MVRPFMVKTLIHLVDWRAFFYLGLAFLFLWWGLNWKAALGFYFLGIAIYGKHRIKG